MTTYTLDITYYAGTSAKVELPEGKTWADVADWYVKWDVLYITFKDGSLYDRLLHTDALEAIDTKRPSSVTVYGVDEDGETNYADEVAEI